MHITKVLSSFNDNTYLIFSRESYSTIANVRQSQKTPQPLRIRPIYHYLHLPSDSHHAHCISAIIPIAPPPQPLRIITIGHHAYQPSCLSAIMPIRPSDLCPAFTNFKPFWLVSLSDALNLADTAYQLSP